MASLFLQRIEESPIRQDGLFGLSVLLSGDGSVMMITSPATSSSPQIIGETYIYTLSGTQWVFLQKIVLPGYISAIDHPSQYCAMNETGTIIAIPIQDYDATPTINGGVLIYTFDGNSYNLINILRISPRVKPPAGNVLNIFGFDLAMSGDGNSLVVSAPWDIDISEKSVGGVYILETLDNWDSWTYNELFHDENGVNLGLNVAISGDGNYIYAGRVDDISSSGSVLGWKKGVSGWPDYSTNTPPTSIIIPSDSAPSDYFGFPIHSNLFIHVAGKAIAVNYDGSTVVIGAYNSGANGQTYVFSVSYTGVVTEDQILSSANTEPGIGFGWGISINKIGNMFVVGAQAENVGAIIDVGVNYIFQEIGGVFVETEQISVPNPIAFTYGAFKPVMSGDGSYLAAGSVDETVDGVLFAGAAYIWQIERDTTDLSNRPKRYRALVSEAEANLSATTQELEDINSKVNKFYKWDTKKVTNTTTNIIVVSTGSYAAAVWNFETGGLAHTPI
jgi:hypothetical protein